MVKKIETEDIQFLGRIWFNHDTALISIPARIRDAHNLQPGQYAKVIVQVYKAKR